MNLPPFVPPERGDKTLLFSEIVFNVLELSPLPGEIPRSGRGVLSFKIKVNEDKSPMQLFFATISLISDQNIS
jgi:hypothetical protein